MKNKTYKLFVARDADGEIRELIINAFKAGYEI